MTREYARKGKQSRQKEANSGILQRTATRSLPATGKAPQGRSRALGESSVKQKAMQIPTSDRNTSVVVQPKLMVGSRWRSGGSENELQGLPVQAKLAIGQPDDKYEREADRVGAEVARRLNGLNLETSPESQDGDRQMLLRN